MRTIEKFKTMKKSDAAVLTVLIAVVVICGTLAVYGFRMIIAGNLFAVIWTTFTCGGFCITGDEAMKMWNSIGQEEEKSNE